MSWDRTKPQNTEKLKDTPALIRANWDAIAAGTDPELLITNAKVSPTAGIADTKLAQITTAGKVSGAALTSLASIPSGAGAIPVANIPDLSAAKITSGTLSSDRLDTGTTANKILKLDGDAKIPAVDGSLLTNIKPSDLAIASQARGDILYFNGTNWVRLAKGTDGQYLKIGANDPAWAAGSSLGAWVDKSSSYGAQQATTDGFVVVDLVRGGGDSIATSIGYTDANSDPTTERTRCCAVNSASTHVDFDGGFCMPVKKNDYWKVVNSGGTQKVYWIPLGS